MKKVYLVLTIFFLFLPKFVAAGGVDINFVVVDSKMKEFADAFCQEMKNEEFKINQLFKGSYIIRGFFGDPPDETGMRRPAIGIFIGKKQKTKIKEFLYRKSAATVWKDDLYSEKALSEEVKKAVNKVMRRLEELEKELYSL